MRRLSWFLAFLALAAPTGASAAQLNYTLYVLGVPLADAMFVFQLTPTGYGMALRFDTTGLANLVDSNHLDERVSGLFREDRPAPADYASVSRLRGQDRLVTMTWHDGTPVPTQIVPANAGERDDVPEAVRAHAIDPLSSIVLLLRQFGQTGHCDATARSYDGRRLELFEARTSGEEDLAPSSHSPWSGRALRCDFTDKTLAGFHLGSDRADDARERHGTVWFAPIANGARLPIRVSVETRLLGDAYLYLTAATP